jgi:hypothetical protein
MTKMALAAEHDFWGTLSAVGLGIIGVATLALIVSNNSDTGTLITNTGNAFSGSLATALSPVTGNTGGAGSSLGNLSTFPIN